MQDNGKRQNRIRRIFWAVVFVQVLLVAGIAAVMLRRGQEVEHVQISAMEQEIPEDLSSGTKWVSEAVYLPRGIYEVKLRFTTDNQNLKGVYVEAISDMSSPGNAVESSPQTLYGSENEKTFRFQVKRDSRVRLEYVIPEEIRVSGDMIRNGDITFSIEDADVSFHPLMSFRHELSVRIMICILVTVFLYAVFHHPQWAKKWLKENALALGGYALTLFAAMYPLLVKEGIYYGFDMQFQIQRIAYLAEGLSGGAFPVKIQPGWGGGYGDAVGVFYPDLLLYPSALLYLLGYSLQTAYKFYHFLVNTLTYVFGYAAFRRMSGSRPIAVVGSSLHCLFIYRLSNAYTHAALGELGGVVFLPLILLGLWEIYRSADGTAAVLRTAEGEEGIRTEHASRGAWITLAIGLTGLVLSHVLTAYILAPFIILYCLMDIRRTLKKQVLLPLIKAVVLAVCLCLFFLVPMADYMLTQRLTGYESSPERLLSTAAGKRQMFTWKYDVVSEENRPNDLTGGIPRTLGMVSLVILVLALFLIVTRRFGAQQKTAVRVTLLLLLSLYLTMDNGFYRLMTRRSLGPVTKYFSVIDYPWRYMILAGILAAYLAVLCLAALAVPRADKAAKTQGSDGLKISGSGEAALTARRISAAAGIVLLGMAFLQAMQYDRLFVRYAESFEAMDTEAFDSRRFYWEYSIEGSDPQRAFTQTQIETYDDAVTAHLSYRSGTTIYAAVISRSKEETAADFPLWCYRGYRAMFYPQSGKAWWKDAFPGDNNRVRVMVPAGFTGFVRVFFHEPWYWRAAELFSLTVLLVLLTKLYFGHMTKKSENQQNIPKTSGNPV